MIKLRIAELRLTAAAAYTRQDRLEEAIYNFNRMADDAALAALTAAQEADRLEAMLARGDHGPVL